MANRPSRDALLAELARRGLPPAYIERLLGELDDHYNDLLEERSSSMGAARKLDFEANDLQECLGEPTQLAIFAAEQFRARSFWGRHPIVTFVLGPVPFLLACWIATLLGITWIGMGLVYVTEHWFGFSQANWGEPKDHLWSQAIMMVAVSWFVIVIPPLSIAMLLCRTARRNAVDWRWPIAACTLLAIVAGFVMVSFHVALAPNEGQFMVGFNFGSSVQWLFITYLPKFAAAMFIGLLLVKRSQQKLKLAT
ncbi:MAG TPA: hypothetical protein VH107_17125 [Lacipirellulaceae bacterium]|nr:hypothetical protein [Lacipirellulaceae bacterium]